MLAIGNNEFDGTLGKYEPCPKCGEEAEVQGSKPPVLQFVKCCGKSYLVGIENRRLPPPSHVKAEGGVTTPTRGGEAEEE